MTSKSIGLCLERNSNGYAATVVISVYKDVPKLACVLYALSKQTFKNFEVIVSEDGNSAEMRDFLAPLLASNMGLRHHTQEDLGFRKNKALNNAIRASLGSRLIFIDGDCVPHPRFIEAHVALQSDSSIGAGRRTEMGPVASRFITRYPKIVGVMSNSLAYVALMPLLLVDRVKNPESAFYSKLFQFFVRKKDIPIVGCNFSCSKRALEIVNGFNEDYEAPGIGEDTDLELRLRRAGFEVTNIKFTAVIFHIYHPRTYELSPRNLQLLRLAKSKSGWRCEHGLEKKEI